jgi:hypothetical protein
VNDYCIIFAHHFASPIVERHLELCHEHNPGVPIVPVSAGPDRLPGADNVQAFCDPEVVPYLRAPMGGDYLLMQWFKHRQTVMAKRYVLVEWDCLVQDDVREYFGPFQESVLAASYFEDFKGWPWAYQAAWMPAYLQASLAGIAPLNGTSWSRDALEAIVALPYPVNGAISELRAGTVLRHLGVPVRALGHDYRGHNDWYPVRTRPFGPGIWHTVKGE